LATGINTDSVVLAGNSDISDLAGDLKRLCQVFEHIEKLLILAASIHRKLIDAPRLAQAIFADYFNYYLPKMGSTLESICYDKVNIMFFTLCSLHMIIYMNKVDGTEMFIHSVEFAHRLLTS
jgi:hypothetical protein